MGTLAEAPSVTPLFRRGPAPRPAVAGLRAYRLPREAPVKLDQNESPLDWPPDLKAEVLRRVATRPWNRYPPVDGEAVRDALGRSYGVAPSMIAVTNGSNEAILALVATFAAGQAVVLPAPSYSMAGPLAVIGGATPRAVPLRPDFGLDVEAMVDAIREPEVAMVFLASPNNPTGNLFDRRAVAAVLEAARGLVVIDEAYAGFAGASWLPALRALPHMAIVATFSKGFALAGARVGWIAASEPVVAAVRKALPPYNLNLFAQEAALVALERPELLRARAAAVVRERERVRAALAALDGVEPFPSATNFILFRTRCLAPVLFERLLARGVLVRDISAMPLLDRCLRVTVGSPHENDAFLRALAASLEERG